MRIRYYLKKLLDRIKELFSIKRILRYGFRKSWYDFIVFMCHRSNSQVQLWAEKKKDLITQRYLYKKYCYVIERYKDR